MPWFQKKLNENGGNGSQVNLTPLIDVSLVLVVILLLATPLAFQSSFGLKGAKRSGKQSEQNVESQRVEIEIVSEDSLLLNRRLVARATLASRLKPLLAASNDRLIVLTCADEVSHGTFVNVIDEAKLCGAGEIAMQGR
jgi:biopolymer transport protein ExbD